MPENNSMVPDDAVNGSGARRRFAHHQSEIRINLNMRDQHSIFGNFVATKLRNIDERFLQGVKFQIEQLLIQAERSNPNDFFGNALRNNLRMFDMPRMPIYTPHPANQPFIFPFFTLNHPFVQNIPLFFPLPNVPFIENPNFAPPIINGPERRPPVPPMAYPPQFANLMDLPVFPPFNEENNFHPPAQQYFNFHVPSGNRGRPKRNGQNADYFNPQRNFGGPRNQQQQNDSADASSFRNNSFFPGTASGQSSSNRR
ncbi:hypothetical protein ILUMI_01019 [Ignelater luminosus]|uniref:Uncharacterized protein n=1 Tax=Ignelater luminosus TaxID=2038154 RepID=A0A8K0GM36_IGNLU|nr:hypothetical protein ILUMI_01019 [Ignelater luminosus]